MIIKMKMSEILNYLIGEGRNSGEFKRIESKYTRRVMKKVVKSLVEGNWI